MRISLGTVLTFAILFWGVRSVPHGASAAPRASAVATRTPISTGDVTQLDPQLFADGACVAFPPTAGDRHETVFLDAGHGGIDPGSIGTTEQGATIEEAHDTLPVELQTLALLRADGYRVVVSRTGDTTVLRLGPDDVSGNVLSLQGAHDDVAARAACANLSGAAVLVGIYFDAGYTVQNGGSVTVYDADRPFAAQNLELATVVQRDVLFAMDEEGWQIPNEGVQTDGTFGSISGSPADGGIAADAAAYGHLMLLGPAMAGYFTTPSQMPGAVVEPLFITDPFEGTLANSALGQRVIAGGIAMGIEQYLQGAGDGPTPTTAPMP